VAEREKRPITIVLARAPIAAQRRIERPVVKCHQPRRCPKPDKIAANTLRIVMVKPKRVTQSKRLLRGILTLDGIFFHFDHDSWLPESNYIELALCCQLITILNFA
jgi:hypothetical protein